MDMYEFNLEFETNFMSIFIVLKKIVLQLAGAIPVGYFKTSAEYLTRLRDCPTKKRSFTSLS